MKKILVIGAGGREHALAWKISKNRAVEKIFIAPGNGGTSTENKCENVNIASTDFTSLINFVKTNNVDLTIVGPEEPLALGIVDEFMRNGLKIFGPTMDAARIEASKSFAKEIMLSANIPTASYKEFYDYESAIKYLNNQAYPIVIKVDGLAAGKGVKIVFDLSEAEIALNEIFIDKAYGYAGEKIIIEEYLEGEEASYLAFTDGNFVLPLVSSQDHKPIYNHDEGPNTGGMGAYCPAPIVTDDIFNFVTDCVAYPLIKELARRNIVYKGIIYAGIMITKEGPKVLEFNCRMGDPETQPIVMKMKSDILQLFQAVTEENLTDSSIKWHDGASVCVVMSSQGYPGAYVKGVEIEEMPDVDDSNIKIFHAGTAYKKGELVTNGGRVFGVTSKDEDLAGAIKRAYEIVGKTRFEGAYYRTDIGLKAIRRL